MYKNKKILAIIPARGGSKGIPNKNIKLVNGKPLISYTILAAKNCKYIDDVIVSTDSRDIASIAKKYGAKIPFLRPKKLATDKSKTIDCIVYTINKLKKSNKIYDILVLLQPTSPLRTCDDISKALDLFVKYGKNVTSIHEININPLLYRSIDDSNKLKKLLNASSTMRRQDLPKYYKVNGAIYINNIKALTNKTSLNDNEIGYIMNPSDSVDIDNIDDLNKASKLLKSKNIK